MRRWRPRRGASSSAKRSSTISRPASARPRGFANAVVPALGALSRLSTGTLVVSDREVKLSGDALYEAAAVQIRAGLGKDFPQGWQFKAGNLGQAGGGAGRCHRLPAVVRRSARQGEDPLRIRPAPPSIADSAGLLDRLIETALRCPTANIEIAGHTDGDGEAAFNQDAVREARAGGDRLSGQGRPAGRAVQRGRLRQHAAGRRQRYRRRQGAEPPHRFRGEVTAMMAIWRHFYWGWLLASLLLGFAMGWIAVVHRGQGVSKNAALVAGGAGGGAGRLAAGRARGSRPLRLLARPRPDHVRRSIWSAVRSDPGCATGWSRGTHAGLTAS